MLIISAISECSCLRFLVTLWVAAGSIVMVAEMVWLVLVHLQGDLSATRADLLPRKVTCLPLKVTCLPLEVTCLPLEVPCLPLEVTCLPLEVTCSGR